MPAAPTVSVVIPTFNRAHTLGRAIESVRAQTYQDWELFVVDDCSVDNTKKVVEGFCDPRIHYLAHSSNRGGGGARNTGIQATRGEYIAFLDSDDEWLPGLLERLLELYHTSPWDQLGVVRCGTFIVSGGKTTKDEPQPPSGGGWVYEKLLTRQVRLAGAGTYLLRRAAFAEVPLFDESFPHGQPREWLARLAKQCQFAWIPDPLLRVYVDGKDRLTADTQKVIEGWLKFLERFSADLARWPKVLAGYHCRIARLYDQIGDVKGVRRHLRLAVRVNPSAVHVYPQLLAAYFGRAPYQWMARAVAKAQRLAIAERNEV